MAEDKDPSLHIGERLAYRWDQKAKKIEEEWLPALNPPNSFRAVADKVASEKAAKALRRRKHRGIMDL